MNTTYEKVLTAAEIQAHKDQRDALWNEWRDCQRHILQSRADARAEQKNAKKLLLEIDCLQGEIKSGTTLVPRQQELPVTLADPQLDSTDDTDPCDWTTYHEFETGYYESFARAHPAATTHDQLAGGLSRLFPPSQWGTADLVAQVKKWHPSSVFFQDVAHWARVEFAHLDSEARGIEGAVPGITIPARTPMPEALTHALGKGPKSHRAKPAKPAKKRRNRSARRTP